MNVRVAHAAAVHDHRVLEQIGDAKELVQSVMELERTK